VLKAHELTYYPHHQSIMNVTNLIVSILLLYEQVSKHVWYQYYRI